ALAFIQTHDVLVCRYDIAYSNAGFDLLILKLPFAGKRVADFGDWFDYAGEHERIFGYLDQLDLAFISGDWETVDVFRPISTHCHAQLIITLGAQGSVALSNGQLIHQPALPVAQIIDTTGCGDAFQAAFTVNYFQSSNLRTALLAGATQAAQTLQHLGAI
ncbi:MAG TPA: hypothetical protein ENJ56_07505, partial [Anaerolineae bacterium]|nr:hypothetical protein [Anaerolineae bacterium]